MLFKQCSKIDMSDQNEKTERSEVITCAEIDELKS